MKKKTKAQLLTMAVALGLFAGTFGT